MQKAAKIRCNSYNCHQIFTPRRRDSGVVIHNYELTPMSDRKKRSQKRFQHIRTARNNAAQKIRL